MYSYIKIKFNTIMFRKEIPKCQTRELEVDLGRYVLQSVTLTVASTAVPMSKWGF